MNSRGGETDRTLANIRRRRKRLAAQNRPPESETIDDRLAVFQEQRAEEARIQADDLAALLATTAGRLFVRDHAGALDAEAARPAVERALAPLRAARPQAKQTPEAKGPPDDGSRPLPDDDEPPEQPDEEPPKEPDEDEEEPEPTECDALRKELEWVEGLSDINREKQIEIQKSINERETRKSEFMIRIDEISKDLLSQTVKSIGYLLQEARRLARRGKRSRKGGGNTDQAVSPEDIMSIYNELMTERNEQRKALESEKIELREKIREIEVSIKEDYARMKKMQEFDEEYAERIAHIKARMQVIGCDL